MAQQYADVFEEQEALEQEKARNYVRDAGELQEAFDRRKDYYNLSEMQSRIFLSQFGQQENPVLLARETEYRLQQLVPLSDAERIQESRMKAYDPGSPVTTLGGLSSVAQGGDYELRDIGLDRFVYAPVHGAGKTATQIVRNLPAFARAMNKFTGAGYITDLVDAVTGDNNKQAARDVDMWVREWMDEVDTKAFGSDSYYYYNQRPDADPVNDRWYSYNSVGNFAGAGVTYLVAGGLLGKAGMGIARAANMSSLELFAARFTAAGFAMNSSGQAFREVEAEALAKGLTPAEAENWAAGAALVTLPLSYYLNMKFDPIVRYNAGKPLPKSFAGKVLTAGTLNAVQNAGERGGLEIFRFVSPLEETFTEEGINYAAMGASLWKTATEAGAGFAMGSAFGTFQSGVQFLEARSAKQMLITDLFRQKHGVYMDAYGPRELFAQAKKAGISDANARAWVAMHDALVKQYIQEQHKAGRDIQESEAWGMVLANQIERQDLSQQILVLKSEDVPQFFLKSRRLLESNEFAKNFGDKPIDPVSVGQWLKNRGVRPAELEWTGLNDLLITASATNKKVTRKQMMEVLDQNYTRVETAGFGEKVQAEFQQQIDVLKAKTEESAKEIRKLWDELDGVNDLPENAEKLQNLKEQIEFETLAYNQLYNDISALSSEYLRVGRSEEAGAEILTQIQDKEYVVNRIQEKIERLAKEHRDLKAAQKPNLAREIQIQERLAELTKMDSRMRADIEDLKARKDRSDGRWESIRPKPRQDGHEYEEITIRFLANPRPDMPTSPKFVQRDHLPTAHYANDHVIVHMRFDKRQSADGEVWQLIELQSDWNQQGRDKGFKDKVESDSETDAAIAQVEADLKAINEEAVAVLVKREKLSDDWLNSPLYRQREQEALEAYKSATHDVQGQLNEKAVRDKWDANPEYVAARDTYNAERDKTITRMQEINAERKELQNVLKSQNKKRGLLELQLRRIRKEKLALEEEWSRRPIVKQHLQEMYQATDIPDSTVAERRAAQAAVAERWNANEEYQKLLREYTDKQDDLADQAWNIQNRIMDANEQAEEKIDPNAFQTTDQWVDLAIKHLFKIAVERGVERIVWAPGDMQNIFQGGGSDEMLKGRKHFYDVILPKKILALLRKYDPEAKLETTHIGGAALSNHWPSPEAARDAATAMLSVLMRLDDRYGPRVSREMQTLLHITNVDINRQQSSETDLGVITPRVLDTFSAQLDILASQIPEGSARDTFTNETVNRIGRFYTRHGVHGYEAPMVRLSKTAQEKMISEGFSLYHTTKGSTTFLNNGKAFYDFFAGADFEVAIHEMGHLIRRTFLHGSDLKIVEDALGIQNGIWDRKMEERFTEWFMQSLERNGSTHPHLATVFAQMQGYLKKAYRVASSADHMPPKMNDRMYEVMSRLITDDNHPIAAARLRMENARTVWDDLATKLRVAQRALKKVDSIDNQTDVAMLTALNANAKQAWEAARTEWKAEFNRRFTMQPSSGQRRKEELAERMSHIQARDYKLLRSGLHELMRQGGALVESVRRLGDTPFANLYKQLLDDVATDVRLYHAKFDADLKQFVADAPPKVKAWFRQVEDPKTGQTNLMRMFDEKSAKDPILTAPSEWHEAIRLMHRMIHDTNTKAMLDEQVHRQLGSKSWVRGRESFYYTVPRMLTETGRSILLHDKVLLNKLIDIVKELNPNVSVKLINDEFGRMAKRINRRSGQLEFSRKIPLMPDVLIVDGKRYDFFHNDPYETLSRMVDLTGVRISWIKHFGQAVLKNVYKRPGVMRKVAKVFGERSRLTNQELIDILVKDKGEDPAKLKGLKQKDILALAKVHDVSEYIDAGVLYDKVMSLSPERLKKRKDGKAAIGELRALAKSIGGINEKAPVEAVLHDIKRRLSEDIEDNVLEFIKKGYAEEGGKADLIDLIAQDVQGMMRTKWAEFSATSLGRGLKFYSTMVGLAHTSMATTKGIFQTAQTLPAFGGFWGTLKAWGKVLDDYEGSRNKAVEIGAIKNIVRTWGADDSYTLVKYGKIFREAGGKFLGHDRIAELNNVVAAEIGFELARQWKTRFSPADVSTAKMLLLNERDIKMLQNGQMNDRIEAKIVQNVVARTQEGGEAPHRRGEIELNPLVKMLFSYQTFAARQTRMALGVYEQFRGSTKEMLRAAKAGDAKAMSAAFPAFWRAASSAMTMVATAIGTGMLIKLTQRVIKQQPELDEDWEEWVKDAILESSVLGLWSAPWGGFDRNTDSKDVVLGFSPIITATIQLSNLVAGWGRYGRFGADRRTMETFFSMTPLAQTVRRQIDHFMYPELEPYLTEKARTNQWIKEQRDFSMPTIMLNPKYDAIWNHAIRGDIDEMRRAAGQYYRKELESGIAWDDALGGLRQSLMARRPINLSFENKIRYLKTLTPDERRRALIVDRRYSAYVDLVAPPPPQ